MDIIETIKKDKAYVKCKLVVKNWEKDFKLKYSRTPTKFDIKEAPPKIKYAYKKYFQLKSNALENSLSVCDIDIDDEMSMSLEPVQALELENVVPNSPSPVMDIPTLPSGMEIEKLLSNVHTHEHKTDTPFTESLSKKLFKNRQFSLRNPRKLSLVKSQTTSQELKSSQDINAVSIVTPKLTDGDEGLVSTTDFNFYKFTNMSSGGNYNNKSISESCTFDNVVRTARKLDGQWLSRITGIEHVNTSESDNSATFGITNIVVAGDKQADYVENSESDDEDIALSKLKPAYKKRKLGDKFNASTSRHEPHTLDKTPDNANKFALIQGDKNVSKTTKKLYDNDEKQPDISDFVAFGYEKDIIPRHSQISSLLKEVNLSSDKSTTENSTGSNHLDNKIKSGTLNENFVKINIEKKVFVRGKKGINFSKYKKQQWKNKKSLHGGMEFPESGKISCFKCGNTGHMARYCRAHKGENLLPLDSYSDNEIPTLQEMENYASAPTCSTESMAADLQDSLYQTSQIPDSFLKMLHETPNIDNNDLKPIYNNINEDFSNDINQAMQKFGYKSFRPGQEHAIKRILCGLSTLLILPTGGGKSLCYQLPAYIYSQHHKCITLVISPLVSLMEDQVLNVPEFLKAGCYHTNQSQTQRQKILECLKQGLLNILLISPEALVAGDTANGLSGLFKALPTIAFACIDEAHCVSQWSHNFRPSYLMICRVLREKLNVKCILGLTATASQTTIKSIINHINVPDTMAGVIKNPTLPDNLYLSVSTEKDKDKALISYLFSEEIALFNSIIVYCIRRDECERVAAVLRSCLQEVGKVNMESKTNKRKRMSYIAEAYHAGMSAAQRKKIQKHFMDGTLRIIVATVAFGMGINKSDIRCIIHYNMPSSFESYVQEVGRAGRDGKPAYCHVMLSKSETDKNELLKHIYANSIDRPTIRKLLSKVFVPCECVKQNKNEISFHCKGHEIGIPIETTVEELDLPSENIATLLCYVELHPMKFIKLLNNAYIKCKVYSYGGPSKIHEAAKSCRPLAMALLLESKSDSDVMKKSVIEFNVIEVAAGIGLESGLTKYQLKNLEWTSEGGMSRRSYLKVELNTLGFRIRARGDLNAAQLDSILDDLHNTVITQEKAKLYQLEECHTTFHELGKLSLEQCLPKEGLLKNSKELKNIIENYFERENLPATLTLKERPLQIEQVISDIRALICTYKDCNFSGRSIARIFQGIQSPNYPAIVWGKCKFWRSHLHEDFNGIIKLATQQLLQMK